MQYKLTSIVTVLISVSIFLLYSCRKTQVGDTLTINNPITNTPAQFPIALAGADLTMTVPLDSLFLNGSSIAPNGVEKVEWKKISGADCNIILPNSFFTIIKGLKEGTYQFELTVTDKKTLIGKDTIQVTVIPKEDNTNNLDTIRGTNFIIFKNLTWLPIWYNNLEIPNINFKVPSSNPIKVFVQRGFDTTWIEVNHYTNSADTDKYDYFIETRPFGAGMYNYGSLYINYYGYINTDKPNVKIEF